MTWNTKDELLELIHDNLFTEDKINDIVENKQIVEFLRVCCEKGYDLDEHDIGLILNHKFLKVIDSNTVAETYDNADEAVKALQKNQEVNGN
jgi:hypothetical protein